MTYDSERKLHQNTHFRLTVFLCNFWWFSCEFACKYDMITLLKLKMGVIEIFLNDFWSNEFRSNRTNWVSNQKTNFEIFQEKYKWIQCFNVIATNEFATASTKSHWNPVIWKCVISYLTSFSFWVRMELQYFTFFVFCVQKLENLTIKITFLILYSSRVRWMPACIAVAI